MFAKHLLLVSILTLLFSFVKGQTQVESIATNFDSLPSQSLDLDSAVSVVTSDSIQVDTTVTTNRDSVFLKNDSITTANTDSIPQIIDSTKTLLIDTLKVIPKIDAITVDSLPILLPDTLINVLPDSIIPIADTLTLLDTIPVIDQPILTTETNHTKAQEDSIQQHLQDTLTAVDTLSINTLDSSSIQLSNSTPVDSLHIKIDSILTEVEFLAHAFDSITRSPLRASIIMSSRNIGKQKNGTGICNSSGIFKFSLLPHSIFEITISASGYIPVTEIVDLGKVENLSHQFKKEYPLQKFKVGDIVRLPNINFKRGDFHLQREAFPVLDRLANMMFENPHMAIKLKGHTDNRGSATANLKLSQKRINEVRYYLLRKGIKLNRLKGEGYGGTQPQVSNDTEEHRKINRRVEFEVLRL